jgi:tRNA 5-methylaminomethyl-2-thiouridine biosynthesis bifunctional protein
MSRLPSLPDLDWSGAAPRSREKDDVYFSAEGLAEKRQVFLSGCGLPEAWAGRERFSVGELGFGSGLSFLALWDLWRRHRPSPSARLDVLSFEGMLMQAKDAARIHILAAWPELADLSRLLLASWPQRARGMQRVAFPDGVTLTLAIDDIVAALPQARASIDAWFLDGFAPAKNPEMWSAETVAHVARLSAPAARAASYAVAGDVRRNLEAAGFSIEKKPGFGRKKERLEALLPGTNLQGPSPKSVAIIGAGIAGACAARAFLDRGCDVTVIDQAGGPGAGASGNPLALVMPRLDAVDGPAARALIGSYLLARRLYARLGREAAAGLTAIHRPRDDGARRRFTKLLADPPLDKSLFRPLDPNNPSAGLRLLHAMAVRPSEALPRLLDGAALRFGTQVTSLGGIDADLIVVCAGMGLAEIKGVDAPPLTPRLGQLECAPSASAPNAVADGGYAVEAFGQLVFGATFEDAKGEPQVSEAARARNLETLARLRPDLRPDQVSSRAAIRATTSDRLPFAGPPPMVRSFDKLRINSTPPPHPEEPPRGGVSKGAAAHHENEKAPDADPAPSQSIRLIGGLGSRGFLWAPLLAELVASEVFGEPSPVEANVAEALDPGRFRRRLVRRSG